MCALTTEHEQVEIPLPLATRWACCNESDHGGILLSRRQEQAAWDEVRDLGDFLEHYDKS